MGRVASVAEAVLELEGHRKRCLSTEVTERLRHPVAGVSRRWLDFERLFKRRAGGAKVSLDHPRFPKETPRLDDARVIGEVAEEQLIRRRRISLGEERLDEAVDDDERLGVGIEGEPVVGLGPVEVAPLDGGVAELPVGVGPVGIERQGPVPKFFSPGVIAEGAMDRPEERPAGRISRKIGQERLGDLEAFIAEPGLELGGIREPYRLKHRPRGHVDRQRLRVGGRGGLRSDRPGPLGSLLTSLPRRQFFVGGAAATDDDHKDGKPHDNLRSHRPARPRLPAYLSLLAGRHVARLPADGPSPTSIGRHRERGSIRCLRGSRPQSVFSQATRSSISASVNAASPVSFSGEWGPARRSWIDRARALWSQRVLRYPERSVGGL